MHGLKEASKRLVKRPSVSRTFCLKEGRKRRYRFFGEEGEENMLVLLSGELLLGCLCERKGQEEGCGNLKHLMRSKYAVFLRVYR